MKDQIKEEKKKDLILKSNILLPWNLVSLILNAQIGTKEVKTKDAAIYKLTLTICKIRKDDLAKHIELGLL